MRWFFPPIDVSVRTGNRMEKESTSLMEKAYRLIRNMMLQQKLAPGQKLIYRDLSEKLNISKTPIMYALGRLEQE